MEASWLDPCESHTMLGVIPETKLMQTSHTCIGQLITDHIHMPVIQIFRCNIEIFHHQVHQSACPTKCCRIHIEKYVEHITMI